MFLQELNFELLFSFESNSCSFLIIKSRIDIKEIVT